MLCVTPSNSCTSPPSNRRRARKACSVQRVTTPRSPRLRLSSSCVGAISRLEALADFPASRRRISGGNLSIWLRTQQLSVVVHVMHAWALTTVRGNTTRRHVSTVAQGRWRTQGTCGWLQWFCFRCFFDS